MYRRYISTRAYLLGLIAAAVVPVWLLAGYLLLSFAMAQQQAYRDQATQLATQSATATENAVDDLFERLDVLADALDPADPSLEKLTADARLLTEGTGYVVTVVGADDRQLLTTRRRADGPTPDAFPRSPAERDAQKRSLRDISNVFVDRGSGVPSIALSRPVMIAGEDCLLMLTVPTVVISRILRDSTLPGWVVGIADREGICVARSERHEEVSGKPGLASYMDQAVGTSGTFTATNQFGEALLAGYFRSPRTGWLYGANINLATVEAPLRSSLLGLLGISVIALLVSFVLTYVVAQALTRQTGGLVEVAKALGDQRPLPSIDPPMAEYALINDALVSAHRMLGERTRQLGAVLETAPVAVWFTYDPAGRQVIRNEYAADLMGLPKHDRAHFGVPDQVIDTVAIKDGRLVSREDRPLTRAMRGEHTDGEEFSYILPGGAERSLLTSARPIRDAGGAIVGAVQISLDITERRKGEEERRLLTNELNHRVKNNLAIVQSLAQQTLRNASSLEDAGTVLAARLGALGHAHDILTQSSWAQGGLREVVERSVMPQAPTDRVDISGRDVAVPPDLVMVLTLALHELTTNAVKYGALAGDDGRISISWDVAEPASVLTLTWLETGAAAPATPVSGGFGTRLLERLANGHGGSIRMAFEATGLRATLTLPMRREQ
jgi:PAS domain S-box-containing protein